MAFGIHSERTEFADYRPTAKEPGPWFTIGTILVCFTLNLFLLIVVRVRTRKHRLLESTGKKEQVGRVGKPQATITRQGSVVSSKKVNLHPSDNNKENDFLNDEGDDSSSTGSVGSKSLVLSQLVSNVVDARSKMTRNRKVLNGNHHRRRMTNKVIDGTDRSISSSSSVSTRSRQNNSSSNNNNDDSRSLADSKSKSAGSSTRRGGNSVVSASIQRTRSRDESATTRHENASMTSGSAHYYSVQMGHHDQSSVSSDSLMTTSIGDGASNGGGGGKNGGAAVGDEAFTYVKVIPPKEQGFLEKVLEAADYDVESHRLIELFLPYSIQSLAMAIFGMINIALIGFHMGVQAVNVYLMVGMLLELSSTLTYGFAEAIGTLGPQADGAGNRVLAGRYLQLSIVLYFLLSLPSLAIWGLFTERVVSLYGFDQETAEYAQLFAYPYMVTYMVGGLDAIIFEFLDVMGHEKYTTVIYLIYSASSTVILVLLIVVTGTNDLISVGIAQGGWAFMLSVANFGVIVYNGWLDDYWEGLILTNGFKDRKAVKTMMTTAIPLSIAWILTYGEWEILTIFAGFVGPAEVAAWLLLGHVWEVFEEVITALGSAIEVRIAFLLGAGMHEKANLSANKAIYMAVILSVTTTAVLFTIAGWLSAWLTPDPTLQHMIFETIPLLGVGQIFMSIGLVCWSIVEGQGRIPLATLVEFVSSWFVVIPMAAVLVFGFDFNLVGIVAALDIGYTIGGVWTTYIIMTTDWEEQSRTLIERHTSSPDTPLPQMDWDSMPEEYQTAAEVLGYTEASWISQTKTALMAATAWVDLTNEQRTAARLLGLKKKLWEEDWDIKVGDTDSSVVNSKRYDEYDWDDLPSDIQEAATILGYTKRYWNRDITPKQCDSCWCNLSPTMKEAAMKLGYTSESWDNADSSSSSSSSSGD